MAKNCWRRMSPMEHGIGLALIVTISFLFIMCVVYLIRELSRSGLFGGGPESAFFECGKACRCLDEFTRLLFFPLDADFHGPPVNEPNEVPFIAKSLFKPEYCLGRNYSIAAIVKQSYFDDLKSFEFLSSAVILSTTWLIAKNTSAYMPDDAIFAAVGSKHWSKSGYLHKVKEIISIQEFLILFELKMEIIIPIDFLDLSGATLDMQQVKITTWDDVNKHEEALETNYTLINSSSCNEYTFCAVKQSDDSVNLEYALATSENYLYGFYNDTVCYQKNTHVHRFISIRPYIFDITLYIKKNIFEL